uniref:ResB-like domain-containing protein n=1 Tax=Prasinoderma singulare TaxID=676789 RepID=A0A7S3B924_9VIRI
MDGLRVRVDGADRALRLPMADLAAVPAFQQANGGSDKTWGTFVPAPGSVLAGERKGATVVAKDMQQVFIYGDDGQFVGVRRLASKKPIEAGGMQLVVEGLVGASGVQVKADPGVPYVYAGFAGLMATTILSYASHSQVWALQTRGEEGGEEEDGVLLVGGRSNRARLGFAEELQTVVGALPARSSATEVSNVQQ